MMLAATMRGCLSAGCVVVEPNVNVEGLEEHSLLREITDQEATKVGPWSSFRRHCRAMRRSFLKEQKRLIAELKRKIQYSRDVDAEGVRSIVELAIRKGFRGGMFDRAKMIVADHDAESLMEQELEKIREEVSSLLKVLEEQGISASAEAEKSELRLHAVLRSRDRARAQANAAEEAASMLEDELLIRASEAVATQRALEAEIAGLRTTMSRQHREAFDEAERYEATTRMQKGQLKSLKNIATLLSGVTVKVKESFSSTIALWKAQLDFALQHLAEADGGVRASQSEADAEKRAFNLAHSSREAELRAAIEARDEATRRAAAAEEELAILKKEIIADEERAEVKRLAMREALERVGQGWGDSRAEAESAAVAIARQRPRALNETEDFAAAVTGARATVAQDAIHFLHSSCKDMELKFMFEKHACEEELEAMRTTLNASALSEAQSVGDLGSPITVDSPLRETTTDSGDDDFASQAENEA